MKASKELIDSHIEKSMKETGMNRWEVTSLLRREMELKRERNQKQKASSDKSAELDGKPTMEEAKDYLETMAKERALENKISEGEALFQILEHLKKLQECKPPVNEKESPY
jgi:hypothetical protein